MITQNAQIYRVQGTSAYLDSKIRPKLLAYNTQSNSLQYSVSGLGWDYFLNSNQVQSLIETNFAGQNSYLPLSGGTVYGNVSANSFIKNGGTSAQFLKADGTVDSNSYLPLSGGTLTGVLKGNDSFWRKNNTVTSSSNVNFGATPIVIETSSSGNYSVVAGIGFHNRGANGSMLYYDPVYSNFMHNNNVGGIYTLWDSRNFIPGNYLPLSGGTLTGTLTLLSGQNGLVSTNTVNQSSAASIRINNVSAGNGLIVNNTGISGCGVYIQQMNNNPNSVGLYVYSNSAAPGIVVDGKISATQYFVQNGLSTQFLKANGTVDSTAYSYKLWGGAGVVDADAISGPVSAIPAVTIPAGLLNTRTVRVSFSYQIANVGPHSSYIMVNLGGIQYTDSTFGAGSNGNSFGKVTLTYKAYLDGSAGKVGQVAWCEGKHDTGIFLSNQSYVGSEMSTLNLNNPITLYVSIIEASPTATVWVYQPMIEVL